MGVCRAGRQSLQWEMLNFSSPHDLAKAYTISISTYMSFSFVKAQ
jgi:hypothetical protein